MKISKVNYPRSNIFVLISWTFPSILALQKVVYIYMVTIGTVQIRLEHTHPIMYLKSIFEVHFYLYFSWKTVDFLHIIPLLNDRTWLILLIFISPFSW